MYDAGCRSNMYSWNKFKSATQYRDIFLKWRPSIIASYEDVGFKHGYDLHSWNWGTFRRFRGKKRVINISN